MLTSKHQRYQVGICWAASNLQQIIVRGCRLYVEEISDIVAVEPGNTSREVWDLHTMHVKGYIWTQQILLWYHPGLKVHGPKVSQGRLPRVISATVHLLSVTNAPICVRRGFVVLPWESVSKSEDLFRPSFLARDIGFRAFWSRYTTLSTT